MFNGRRLLFTSNRNLIQSEARLTKVPCSRTPYGESLMQL